MRVYNFSAGPSVLPLEVLERAKEDLICYKDSGMSVMEMSHRSKIYEDILNKAKSLVIELLNVPDDYDVLFLQGGASSQFAMVPLNLYTKYKACDLINTGQWTKKAKIEAAKYGKVNVVASSEDANFNYIPDVSKIKFNDDVDYTYICLNNTIYGTKYYNLPNTKTTLVGDFSSSALSEPIDVSKFGILFAGAQKNLGPAGVTLVIIKKELLGHALDITPTMFDYKVHSDNNSMYNTPPTYGIYMMMLVLEWLKDLGGLKVIEKNNIEKAKLLYDYLDESDFFQATVEKPHRSLMNVPFILRDKSLDSKFIKEAGEKGLVNLKGHRSVGGMRASIYNAMPLKGVESLVSFMNDFEKNNK